MKKITSTLSALLLAANLFTLPAAAGQSPAMLEVGQTGVPVLSASGEHRLIMSQSIAFLWTSVKMATRYLGRLNAISCPVIPQR